MLLWEEETFCSTESCCASPPSYECNELEDPDYILPSPDLDQCEERPKRRCVRPTIEVLEDEDDEDDDQPTPHAKRPSEEKTSTARLTTWKMVDLNNPALPEYQHSQVIKHITCQTNLYATQKDANTAFVATEEEVLNFVAVSIYMGIAQLPSSDDYWTMDTSRVSQVADVMSSKRLRLMKRLVHFNDNTQIPPAVERFIKVHPLFSFLNSAFRMAQQTPQQSVGEVIVGYTGRTVGNLRQCTKNNPHKWGFKLFSRASGAISGKDYGGNSWCSSHA